MNFRLFFGWEILTFFSTDVGPIGDHPKKHEKISREKKDGNPKILFFVWWRHFWNVGQVQRPDLHKPEHKKNVRRGPRTRLGQGSIKIIKNNRIHFLCILLWRKTGISEQNRTWSQPKCPNKHTGNWTKIKINELPILVPSLHIIKQFLR